MPTESVIALARAFAAAGKTLYLVGGTVRDPFLGVASRDIDLTTDALPDEIKMLAASTGPLHIVPIGEKYGTIQLHYATASGTETEIVEVTTYRGERYTGASRKPEVYFGTSLEEDLRRRDFTVNAIAQAVLTAEIVDPSGGMRDLEARVIRAVGVDPTARFVDDPLRLLRAIRFALQINAEIEPLTWRCVREQAPLIRRISQERIRDELSKILLSPAPARGLALLRESLLLQEILPEVLDLVGVDQPPYHTLDVFDHTRVVVQGSPPRLRLRWAALLHDIAKPRTRTEDGGVVHFYGHEEVGAHMALAILRRLRMGNEQIGPIVRMVHLHMRVNAYTPQWTDGAVRRLVIDSGESFDDLLDLAQADGQSDRTEDRGAILSRLRSLRERAALIRQEVPGLVAQSPLDGDELMSLFGRGPGAWIRPLKDYLTGLVIDGELRADDKGAAEVAARSFVERSAQP